MIIITIKRQCTDNDDNDNNMQNRIILNYLNDSDNDHKSDYS